MNGIKQGIEADYGNKHGIYGVAHEFVYCHIRLIARTKNEKQKGDNE